jgi:hypothetical protein
MNLRPVNCAHTVAFLSHRRPSRDDATIEDAATRRLVETLRELANLSAGALVLGQFVGLQPLSVRVVLGGLPSWLALVGAAILLSGEE